MRAFLKGFLFIVAVGFGAEAFASFPPLPEGAVIIFSKTGSKDYDDQTGMGNPPSYNLKITAENYRNTCQNQHPDKFCYVQSFDGSPQFLYTSGGKNYYRINGGARMIASPTGEAVEPECGTEIRPGGPINGGFGSGVYDVQGCAYTCTTDYSKLDGNTSMYDAQSCTGLGQPYTTPDTDDYADAPQECQITGAYNRCMDMDKQPNGSCPTGTTYGRVNDKEVCVKSSNGEPTEPLDPDSAGNPDEGGNMQSKGTPDQAGTGGAPTGSGTSTSTNTSTTTDNGDGTSTTTGESESEMQGPSTFGGHGDPKSWWTSNYPDGAAGIASKFSTDMGNGPFMAMLNPLSSLPSQGSEPSWNWDMNMGPLGNYSGTLTLPAGVWLFIRVCILFTAAMTVRKLIFGG